jgi:hypothetical protein
LISINKSAPAKSPGEAQYRPKPTSRRALPFEAEGHNQIHALQQQPYSITSSDPQITSGEESTA